MENFEQEVAREIKKGKSSPDAVRDVMVRHPKLYVDYIGRLKDDESFQVLRKGRKNVIKKY